MSRVKAFCLAIVVILLGVQSMASNFAVGTCMPSLPSYPTISAAVSTVPPFSTVLVCPGTYPEQVFITYPLTLKGITNGNSSRAVVAIPSGGLSTTSSLFTSGTVGGQIEVTASPVNISNLTVDGTGGGNSCSAWLYGIFYESGSGGTINEVTARNQLNSGCGFGIEAENSSSTAELVTIQNSVVRNYDASGILVGTNQSTLTVNIKGNYVPGGFNGIYASSAGTVSGNIITNNSQADIVTLAPMTISGNTVTDSPFAGIWLNGGGTATSNKLERNAYGVYLTATSTVKSNSISDSGNVAIEFSCTSGNTVSSNTITDAPVGIDFVPSGFVGNNSYFGVDTIRTGGCGFASVRAFSPKISRRQ